MASNNNNRNPSGQQHGHPGASANLGNDSGLNWSEDYSAMNTVAGGMGPLSNAELDALLNSYTSAGGPSSTFPSQSATSSSDIGPGIPSAAPSNITSTDSIMAGMARDLGFADASHLVSAAAAAAGQPPGNGSGNGNASADTNLTSSNLANFDWDKIGFPEAFKNPSNFAPANRTVMFPSAAPGGPGGHVPPGRASWDGTTGSDMGGLGFHGFPLGGGAASGLANAEPHASPGGESSDGSSGSTKRRRMTFSGGDSTHEAGRGRPTAHGHGPTANLGRVGPGFYSRAQSNNIVNSKELEAMAQESLQRASAENRRTTDGAGHLSALPSTLAGSQASPQRQRSTTAGSGGPSLHKRHSGPNLYGATYGGANTVDDAAGPSTSGALGGNAASHPPGLGSSVLKGQDPASSGPAAANDFTRRKGWATRVVDELLDFVHVLDLDGKILYATNAVQNLTGWKPEHLKGKSIYDLIHPQDAPVLNREMARSLRDQEDVTLYYRVRRNPAQIAARAKTRMLSMQSQSNVNGGQYAPSRSRSGSASTPTDSSFPTTSDSSANKGDVNPVTIGEIDPDAEWITMEMVGHPYFPPLAADRETEDNQIVKGEEEQEEQEEQEAAPQDGDTNGARKSMDEDKRRHSLAGSPPTKVYKLPLARSTQGQCFFCSCRVYPSKSVTVLDSFLEIKLENEKLRQQLEKLNLDGGAPGADEGASRPHMQAGRSFFSVGESGDLGSSMPSPDELGTESVLVDGFGQAAKIEASVPTVSLTTPRPPPVSSMTYAGASGIGPSPLVRTMTSGSSTSAFEMAGSPATEGDMRKKKKPQKPKGENDEDRVCTDCGRTDSPEWRKGPLGPKTLCNACGLRYAKKVKRRSGPSISIPPGMPGTVSSVTGDSSMSGGLATHSPTSANFSGVPPTSSSMSMGGMSMGMGMPPGMSVAPPMGPNVVGQNMGMMGGPPGPGNPGMMPASRPSFNAMSSYATNLSTDASSQFMSDSGPMGPSGGDGAPTFQSSAAAMAAVAAGQVPGMSFPGGPPPPQQQQQQQAQAPLMQGYGPGQMPVSGLGPGPGMYAGPPGAGYPGMAIPPHMQQQMYGGGGGGGGGPPPGSGPR